MDILNKIKIITESKDAAKDAKAKSLGLKHVSFDNYKSSDGTNYHWDGRGFVKSNLDVKPSGKGDVEKSYDLIERSYPDNEKITNYGYITKQEGSSNKFHYFAIIRENKNGKEQFIGVNTYGRIGYDPKVIEISRGEDKESVLNAMDKKMYTKTNKGYKHR